MNVSTILSQHAKQSPSKPVASDRRFSAYPLPTIFTQIPSIEQSSSLEREESVCQPLSSELQTEEHPSNPTAIPTANFNPQKHDERASFEPPTASTRGKEGHDVAKDPSITHPDPYSPFDGELSIIPENSSLQMDLNYYTETAIQRLEEVAKKQNSARADTPPSLDECAKMLRPANSTLSSDGSTRIRSPDIDRLEVRTKAIGIPPPDTIPGGIMDDPSDEPQPPSNLTSNLVSGPFVSQPTLRIPPTHAQDDPSKGPSSTDSAEISVDSSELPHNSLSAVCHGPIITKASLLNAEKQNDLLPAFNPDVCLRASCGPRQEPVGSPPTKKVQSGRQEKGVSYNGEDLGPSIIENVEPTAGGTWPRKNEQSEISQDFRVVFTPTPRRTHRKNGPFREMTDAASLSSPSRPTSSINPPIAQDALSCFSDSSAESSPPGLKKRFSALRLRMSESSQRKKRPPSRKRSHQDRTDHDGTGAVSTHTNQVRFTTHPDTVSHSKGLRQRLLRWIVATRHAIRKKSKSRKATSSKP